MEEKLKLWEKISKGEVIFPEDVLMCIDDKKFLELSFKTFLLGNRCIELDSIHEAKPPFCAWLNTWFGVSDSTICIWRSSSAFLYFVSFISFIVNRRLIHVYDCHISLMIEYVMFFLWRRSIILSIRFCRFPCLSMCVHLLNIRSSGFVDTIVGRTRGTGKPNLFFIS